MGEVGLSHRIQRHRYVQNLERGHTLDLELEELPGTHPAGCFTVLVRRFSLHELLLTVDQLQTTDLRHRTALSTRVVLVGARD